MLKGHPGRAAADVCIIGETHTNVLVANSGTLTAGLRLEGHRLARLARPWKRPAPAARAELEALSTISRPASSSAA